MTAPSRSRGGKTDKTGKCFKLEIGLLKSRVIDLETHNDTLGHENSTPKNKIQSMKRQQKILEKSYNLSWKRTWRDGSIMDVSLRKRF